MTTPGDLISGNYRPASEPSVWEPFENLSASYSRRRDDYNEKFRRRQSLERLRRTPAAPKPPLIAPTQDYAATGVAALSGVFQVMWQPSTDIKTVGYNIYRSTQEDNPDVATRVAYVPQPPIRGLSSRSPNLTTINSTGPLGYLTWEDSVKGAKDDYYWVAAVNAGGTESPRIEARALRGATGTSVGGVCCLPADHAPGAVITDFTGWPIMYIKRHTVSAATTGVTITSTSGYENPFHAHGGVASRFVVRGGSDFLVTLQAKFDSYVKPGADPIAGDACVFGVWSASTGSEIRGVGLGCFGGHSLNNVQFVAFEMTNADTSTFNGFNALGSAVTAPATSFEVEYDITYKDDVNQQSWTMTNPRYRIDAGAWTTLTLTAGKEFRHGMTEGLHIGIGMIGNSAHANLAARLIQLTIASGTGWY